MTPTPKPGWQTTEFWGLLIAQVTSIAVILNVVTPEDATTLAAQATEVSKCAFSIIANVGSLLIYIRSRTQIKLK